MGKKNYNLKEIIETVFMVKDNKIKRRLIYDKAPIDGLGSRWIIALFIVMPFAIYAAIFNKTSFEYLGIAQAIVVFIIGLVFAMQVVMTVTYFYNRNIVKSITPSWEAYFPEVSLKLILSRGVTPYVDFMKHYEPMLKENLDNDTLHKKLKESFAQMEKENQNLVNSINQAKNNQGDKK